MDFVAQQSAVLDSRDDIEREVATRRADLLWIAAALAADAVRFVRRRPNEHNAERELKRGHVGRISQTPHQPHCEGQ